MTPLETKALSLGLKYGIKAKRINEYEILARFEELAQSLNRMEVKDKGDELKANLNSKNAFFQQLQAMSTEFIELSKRAMDNLPPEQKEALIELSKDHSIVISKADKDNAEVADYRNKIKEILLADSKFKQLTYNPTKTRETALKTYLRQLNCQHRSVKDNDAKRENAKWPKLITCLTKSTRRSSHLDLEQA